MEKNKNKELTPAEKKQFIEMYEQQQQDKRLLSKLRDNFRLANTEYSKVHRRMRKLDAVDNGDLWKTLAAKYPKYQILPDTNHVSYIKNNILASIYTVGKCANIIPTSEEDTDLCVQLNNMLSYIWGRYNVPMYQMRAGERAALLNLGVTQVGWDNNIIESSSPLRKGKLCLKNIDPLKYMRDPYADSLDNASFVITWERYHETVLLSHPLYGDKFKAILHQQEMSDTELGSTVTPITDKATGANTSKPHYYTVFIHFIRTPENKIAEIHTLDNKYILYKNDEIQPNMFPFAELYCNLPNQNLVGTSEPAKIFANSLAYNLMNSILLTAEYKNQRPPKFISSSSGLNISAFTKHGNDADRTFIVQGDASKAVHYHQFPTPNATILNDMALLSSDIKNTSGIDDRYTGRDTGSVLTTGGIENMLAQVTMVDTTRIALYEDYSARLTELILHNFISNSAKRKYFFKRQDTGEFVDVEVNFPQIPDDAVFDYEIAISSYLPKNKAQIKQMADTLMEKQMQYGSTGMDVDLITPQEWLQFQDFPMAEKMMERMGVQRSLNWQQASAQIIEQYTRLVENGIDPSQAIEMTADTMAAQQSADGGDGVQQAYDNQTTLGNIQTQGTMGGNVYEDPNYTGLTNF